MKQLRLWVSGSILLIIGCVDIQGPTSPPVAAEDVFSEFRFTTDAMMIKHGDTLQLNLVAISAAGTPIHLDPAKIRWVSGDSIRLPIDTAGRITSKALITNPVSVRAEYTHRLSTRRANLTVYVTNADLLVTSLKLVALDSTRVGAGMVIVGQQDTSPLPRVRVDLYRGDTRIQTDVKIPVIVPPPYVATYIATGGPNGEPVYTVSNGGSGIGKFWMTSSINLHGVEVHDSLEFTGTYPVKVGEWTIIEDIYGNISMADPSSGNSRLAQQPCAFTRIWNLSSRSLEVVFSDSLAGPDQCNPMTESVRKSLRLTFYNWGGDQDGGNLLLPPQTISIRRSITQGEISWFLRDAVTKERLPFEGKYSSIYVE